MDTTHYQSQNNFLACEHSAGSLMLVQSLHETCQKSGPGFSWPISGPPDPPNADETFLGDVEIFSSDHMSFLSTSTNIKNEAEMQNSNQRHERNESSIINQPAGLGSKKSGKPTTPSQQRLKHPAAYQDNSGKGQSMYPKTPKEKAQKRNQFLKAATLSGTRRVREQNRLAAKKFRAKKSKNSQSLQAEEEILRKENQKLRLEVSRLRYNITGLKSCLLAHGQCDSPIIQDYINSEASHIVSTRLRHGNDKEKLHLGQVGWEPSG
ncbi:hypothetical protein BGZ63DRAFT_388509 [Mariannaea sp. PMI_226]|nr:hypothetical protein BGZ63DRAFT_388509 [Mariannaea sp. PMI_226]